MKIKLEPINENLTAVGEMRRGETFQDLKTGAFFLVISDPGNLAPGYVPTVALETGNTIFHREDCMVLQVDLGEIKASRTPRRLTDFAGPCS